MAAHAHNERTHHKPFGNFLHGEQLIQIIQASQSEQFEMFYPALIPSRFDQARNFLALPKIFFAALATDSFNAAGFNTTALPAQPNIHRWISPRLDNFSRSSTPPFFNSRNSF